MKKTISVLLALVMLFAFAVPAFSADSPAHLYNVYGDGMLFRRNDTAILAGEAASGASITVELAKDGQTVAKNSTYASKSGTFTVSFDAPEGSYDEYTVTLFENGTEFEKLENVVFGELWLASGQSNMQYPLIQEFGIVNGLNSIGDNAHWIRTLLVPAPSSFGGSTEYCPADPQKEIEGAVWVDAADYRFMNISAVAYYFANKLQKDLDMPVGILNSSLGGSGLCTWLSREDIDNDPEVRDILSSYDRYISYENWNPGKANQYTDMTANYNSKITPLRNFRISGIIWYQGETDLMWGISGREYTTMLDRLQKTFSKAFGSYDSDLPFIYTQLAAYPYFSGFEIADYNSEFAINANDASSNRACISIYDVPLDYFAEVGSIHPAVKSTVGERMAYAAEGFVYGSNDTYTAPTVKEVTVNENDITVSFYNTGNGLASIGDTLYGFAVCGNDGVFTRAEAEIISSDTVKIYSDSVTSPTAASYAYFTANVRANLFSTDENGFAIPAAPFITDGTDGKTLWMDEPWTDCETHETWHVSESGDDGRYNTWTAGKCDISFTSEAAYDGVNGLAVSGGKSFSVSPVLTYKKNKPFTDTVSDYSKTGTMTFTVRNDGETDVTLSQVRFGKNSVTWYSPVTADGKTSYIIPADGEWHEITLDMNTLYLNGNKGGFRYSNNRLSKVTSIEFRFESRSKDNSISVDCIRTAPETEDTGTRFDGAFLTADSAWEYFCALFTSFINVFAELFG